MRRLQTTTILLTGSLLAVACGGGNDMADEMGEAPASEMDVASSGELAGCYLAGATPEEALQRPSPLSELMFSIGSSPALMCYGAPSLRGRAFIGEIEPYGVPWRAGANEPTTLHLTSAASVGGVVLEPGSYSLYLLPEEEGDWSFFVNSNYQRWGIPIDPDVRATEVGSFSVTPEFTDDVVETLEYSWEETDDGMGNVVMRWENWQVSFHIMAADM